MGDITEGRRNAETFLAAFNDLYRAVHFDDYFRDNINYYALANGEVTGNYIRALYRGGNEKV